MYYWTIPFGWDLARISLHTEDLPGLNTNSTGSFTIPVKGSIQCSYQGVFRTGAPCGHFPVNLVAGVLVA